MTTKGSTSLACETVTLWVGRPWVERLSLSPDLAFQTLAQAARQSGWYRISRPTPAGVWTWSRVCGSTPHSVVPGSCPSQAAPVQPTWKSEDGPAVRTAGLP